MLNKSNKNHRYETILLDNLVDQNHLLRQIDRYVNFGFIHEKCKPTLLPGQWPPRH